jgi:hypothetical protein
MSLARYALELAWRHRKEFGAASNRARDKRAVVRWLSSGLITGAQFDALTWYVSRLEASHTYGSADLHRVQGSSAGDAAFSRAVDAANDANGARHAVGKRAGPTCMQALDAMADGQSTVRRIRDHLRCKTDHVLPICTQALETLAVYVDEAKAEREKWNRREFAP